MKNAPILLVDDDPFLRRACEIGLRQRGHAVLVASDGEEGLQKARESQPCLILLDLLMPKMSGTEVLRALKAGPDTSHIPVVVLTNSAAELQLGITRELGALDFIVKADISLKELSVRVEELLHTLYP